MNNALQFEDRVSRSRSQHEENPRLPYATGLAGFAHLVRGSSRRIMIMRFRPANISLINRRHYLPRLLLILSSKRQMQKPPQRFEDVDRVTPYQGRVADHTARILGSPVHRSSSPHFKNRCLSRKRNERSLTGPLREGVLCVPIVTAADR